LVSLSATVQAKPINYGNAIVSEVTSIYDGDTFRANTSTLLLMSILMEKASQRAS